MNHCISSIHSFDRRQLLECASGEMFGTDGARLPSDQMLMFDRITAISSEGDGYDKGIVRAELDIRTDL